jgi:hypothetical protein
VDKLMRLPGLFLLLILSACGSDGDLSFLDNRFSVGSTSSASSSLVDSSSSSSSNSSLSNTEPKQLDVIFADNGCLEFSNADAITDFDFAGSSRRMLSWGCVYNMERLVELDLFYRFDSTLGCYKKIQKNEPLIKGGLYSERYFPDCSVAAITISQPEYNLEITDLNIYPVKSSDSKYGFTFSYELSNVGTIPVTQYKTILIMTKYPSGLKLGSISSYDSAGQLLPDEIKRSDSFSFASPEYKLGDLIEFTFVVTDYYGNKFSSTVKQVSVE